MAKGKRPSGRVKAGPTLFELLQKRQDKVLKVLDKHGVYFDAGTFITLRSSPEKAAAFHAVPDVRRFLADLRKAADGR